MLFGLLTAPGQTPPMRAGSSNMHPRPAFDSGTTLKTHTPYSVSEATVFLQT
jgi:hypothetical protein